MKINLKLSLTIVAIIATIAGIYFLASSVLPRVLTTLTKAAPATKLSIQNSLVIGVKILAKADGEDSCKINVFLLDDNNRGVSGKSVNLAGPSLIKIKTIGNSLSDSDGKVSFEIRSNTEGQFNLTAAVDTVPLQRGITVTFRK